MVGSCACFASPPSRPMEVNQTKRQLKELAERIATLRGFL